MENYKIRSIDEHTWQLEDPFRTYLYLIEDSKKAVLLKPVTVILTHGHFDHTGAAGEFSECYIKEEEQYLVHDTAPENISHLKEGDVPDLGGRSLEVIETPGHTKGSVCFLERENKRLYSGDTVCNREILVYLDHSGTVKTVKESDEKLLSRKSEFTDIWP